MDRDGPSVVEAQPGWFRPAPFVQFRVLRGCADRNSRRRLVAVSSRSRASVKVLMTAACASHGPPGSQPFVVMDEIFMPPANCAASTVPMRPPLCLNSIITNWKFRNGYHISVQFFRDGNKSEVQSAQHPQVQRHPFIGADEVNALLAFVNFLNLSGPRVQQLYPSASQSWLRKPRPALPTPSTVHSPWPVGPGRSGESHPPRAKPSAFLDQMHSCWPQ